MRKWMEWKRSLESLLWSLLDWVHSLPYLLPAKVESWCCWHSTQTTSATFSVSSLPALLLLLSTAHTCDSSLAASLWVGAILPIKQSEPEISRSFTYPQWPIASHLRMWENELHCMSGEMEGWLTPKSAPARSGWRRPLWNFSWNLILVVFLPFLIPLPPLTYRFLLGAFS